jgi:hypothetical protein
LAVSYIEPAERAWARTRRLLFQPVDVERWLVIGFAAFLAGLAGQWAGVSFIPRWRLGFPPDWGDLVAPPFANLRDAFHDSTWFLFGVPFVMAALAIGVALLWLSSRGKFIFLDNMVRGRAAFIDPWKKYGRLGQSLFLWRLGFWLAVALVAGAILWPSFWVGRSLGGTGVGRPFGVLVSFGAAVGSLILGVVVAYIALFLESFVVPLMYRLEITAVEAWRLFLPLLRARLPEFLAYGLVVLLGGVAVFLCLIAAAIATCCILPFLLWVPYVRSVLLLPLSGFYRLYSVEFLQQFGPEFSLPSGEDEAAPVPSSSSSPPPSPADTQPPKPGAPEPPPAPPPEAEDEPAG